MPFNLTDLTLDEISLVDDPASPGAQVVLAKRAGGDTRKKEGEMADMSAEDRARLQQLMDKGMSESDAKKELEKEKEARMADDYKKRAEAAEASVDTLTKQVEELTKAVEGAGMTVTKKDDSITVEKRSDEEYVELGGEKILKSAVPAPVLKQLEAQAKQLEDLSKAAEVQRLDKRSEEEIPNFGGSAKAKRALIKAVDGIGDEETRKEVAKALSAASKLLEKSFTEIGHLGHDENAEGAMGELNKMAAEMAEEKGITFEAAFDKVCQTKKGAELFAKRHSN